jgi:DNA-binding HxlR family transcriptional regulator
MDQVQNPNSWYKICPGCPEYGRVHWSVMEGYGQFCPVAMTAELLTRRWTPLVIRELLEGSHRFNEIRRGVPRMSPSLLVQRLRELEKGGVLVRRPVADGDHSEYHLTPAGEELAPIIMQMGAWGRRWAQSEISRRHLDAGLLMWNIHRKVRTERLPARQVVVRFHFREAPKGERDFWLVLHGREEQEAGRGAVRTRSNHGPARAPLARERSP